MNTLPELLLDSVYLRRIDPSRNVWRFYFMRVEQDLFGEWCLVREWGRIGSMGQVRRNVFANADQAIEAMGKLAKAKRRKGYFEIQ